MKRGPVAACLAAVTLMLPGRASGPVDLRAGEPEPARGRLHIGEGIPTPTMGGVQFWTDELFFHQWRIQRNAVTGHCRLLDGNNLRHAWGTYEHCLARLQRIKRQRNLPPMQGKAVVLLHGLGHSRNSMLLLGKHLQGKGGYTVFNMGYSSTRGGIADHARALASVLDHLDGIEEIHFVAHSLGNIVIRRYLADQTDEAAGRQPDPRIKRFVMLGPPNHGSIAATNLADNKLVEAVLGEPGQELGREWVWTESELATPPLEFGILAGGRKDERGFNPMLPGDDDGVVTVASTRLAGARDFLVVPVLHTLLPVDRNVMEYTLRFLEKGCFVAEDKRQPVEE